MMREEQSFDIYEKLFMPAHHLEFYISFFMLCFGHLFVVMVFSVWQFLAVTIYP